MNVFVDCVLFMGGMSCFKGQVVEPLLIYIYIYLYYIYIYLICDYNLIFFIFNRLCEKINEFHSGWLFKQTDATENN